VTVDRAVQLVRAVLGERDPQRGSGARLDVAALLLDGSGLATVKISIFSPAATKKTLQFVEYANYPDLTPTVGTDGSKVVPSCVNGQIPATGFHSCVVGVDNRPGGGLIGTLLAQGGTDPGWGHT
jgi:hypothetical protein